MADDIELQASVRGLPFRLLQEIARIVLRRSVFRSTTELEAAITACIETVNADPKIFLIEIEAAAVL